MAPFPLVKLAIVFFKQISKPLANQIKVRAKNSEFFKKYVCMPPAQFYHWYDVNLRMRMLGIETKNVAKMNEEAAVALGADILGEAVILSIAVAGLALEYARRSKNDTDKESRQQERLANMESKLGEIEITITNQAAQLLELERLMHHNSSSPSKPDKPSSSSSSSSSLLPVSVSSLLSTNKKPTSQAFSILDNSSMRSSLIQLHTIDYYLFYPIAYAIHQMHNSFTSSLHQLSFWREPKH
ncbi:unnamed protein product [Rotaria socialis]|uniref:OPA3-like protein n=3 Tax=Rotaria socialis TaxID=392032 RepID=A0A820RMJ3_9BILA|nr:unnamed protein product [Rotaria socialis]CAF3587847.1 unnamed protein product [Rotaria socialis]CAF3733231.1 unnamed protein product [Rotaria socialis]CAF4443929.1 unnamed protein product [Rotaria socialis]CAF4520234.1 unnamed protein product [Rotaria socialis]